MQARRWLGASAAMFAVALLIAGCGSSSNDSSGSNSGGGASATTAASGGGGGGGSDKITLTAKGIAFDKTQLNMPAGKQITVTLNNQDSVEHSFTFKDAKAEKDAEGGETAEVSFTAPAAGSYEFHCKYHPNQMKGTVTVS